MLPRGQDQEVEAGDQVGGSPLSFCAGFRVQLVHQIDDIEEPSATPVSDAGPGEAHSEMGFAGSGAADQNQIALVIEEVPGGQVTDQGLVDLSRFEVELFYYPAVVCSANPERAVPWPAAAWQWSSDT